MAIKAFDYYLDNIREMQKTSSSKNISVVPVKLIMAGGYDPRVIENVKHLQELVGLSKKLGLKVHTVWSPSHKQTGTNDNQDDIENSQVLFLPSFTENQRNYLFSKSKCVLYTPTNEHLGIVPLEAMYNKVPVIAIASGGPKETVIDGETGYLVPIPVSKNNTKTSNNDDDDGNGFIESISPEDKVLMIKDMAKYIGKVLENSKVAGEMGRKGRDRVERLFNYNAFGKNVERMLIDMLKHDGKP
ncbi:Alpha-1,3-mannosyltransferase-like protein, partial [Mycoemilia scoparia]